MNVSYLWDKKPHKFDLKSFINLIKKGLNILDVFVVMNFLNVRTIFMMLLAVFFTLTAVFVPIQADPENPNKELEIKFSTAETDLTIEPSILHNARIPAGILLTDNLEHLLDSEKNVTIHVDSLMDFVSRNHTQVAEYLEKELHEMNKLKDRRNDNAPLTQKEIDDIVINPSLNSTNTTEILKNEFDGFLDRIVLPYNWYNRHFTAGFPASSRKSHEVCINSYYYIMSRYPDINIIPETKSRIVSKAPYKDEVQEKLKTLNNKETLEYFIRNILWCNQTLDHSYTAMNFNDIALKELVKKQRSAKLNEISPLVKRYVEWLFMRVLKSQIGEDNIEETSTIKSD